MKYSPDSQAGICAGYFTAVQLLSGSNLVIDRWTDAVFAGKNIFARRGRQGWRGKS
jgi:hypothetical protein